MPNIMQTRWLVNLELCDRRCQESKLLLVECAEPVSQTYVKSCIKDAMDKTWAKVEHAIRTITTDAPPYNIGSIIRTVNNTRDYELTCQIVQADFGMSDIE